MYCGKIMMFVVSIFVLVGCIIPHTMPKEQGKNVMCPKVLNGSGSFMLPSEENCQQYIIKSDTNDSIFKIEVESSGVATITPTASDASEYVTLQTTIEEEKDAAMKIEIREHEDESNADSYAAVATWTISARTRTSKNLYFSRTSHIIVLVTVEGDWNGEEVILSFAEISLASDTRSSSAIAGEMSPWTSYPGRCYRPNHVTVFHIEKSPQLNDSSITIELKTLDIDAGVGEYLLIGSGLKPMEGPPPIFITQPPEKPKKYLVNDENAYVVFVARSTREARKGFLLSWEQTGTKIKVEKEKIDNSLTEDILNSVPVCIYNTSAAIAEFNKSDSNLWYVEFRRKIAELSNDYAKLKNLLLHTNITALRVDLFRVSAIIPRDDVTPGLDDGALYVMLRVKGAAGGRAILTRAQLQDVVENYAACCSVETRGYKVGICPDLEKSSKGWGKMLLYFSIPVFCCVFLIIWTWKQNPLLEYFTKNKMKKSAYKRAQGQNNGNENLYITVPKMIVATEQGKNASLSDDNESDIEIFNKADLKRIRSDGDSLSHNSRSSPNTIQGIINEAYENNEDTNSRLCRNDDDEDCSFENTENVYDSLKTRSKSNPIGHADTRM